MSPLTQTKYRTACGWLSALARWIVVALATMPFVSAAIAHDAGAPWKIMALGDSITMMGYPAKLWQKLTQAHLGTFEFIGSMKANTGGVDGFSGSIEAHGGYNVTNLLKPSGPEGLGGNNAFNDSRDLQAWFGNADPDILLMHIGSTSGYGGRPNVSLVLHAYSAILTAVRTRNPQVIVLIAQIIPLAVPQAKVRPINDAIPRWAATSSMTASPIVVVDMFTGFDSATATRDGIHPNDIGSQWLADKWFDALVPLLEPISR